MKKILLGSSMTLDSCLVHGLNNVGKSHFLGSMLAHEKQYGKCWYLNMTGEPTATLLAHELSGVELVEIEKVEDIPLLVSQMKGARAIALDSVQRLGELAGVKVTDGKYLVGAKEDHGRDWAKLKFEIFKVLMLAKQCCELFVAVCPSRHHENAITKAVRIVPDAAGVSEVLQGRFNFVGYLTATLLTPEKVTRQLDFSPRLDVVTRFNAPIQLKKPITLPEGTGAWVAVKTVLEGALTCTPAGTAVAEVG